MPLTGRPFGRPNHFQNIGTRTSGIIGRRRDQLHTQMSMYASHHTTVLRAIPSKRNRNIATPYGKIQIS